MTTPLPNRGRRPIQSWEWPLLSALGKAVKDARLRADMTVREVADASQLSTRHLYRVERGERRTRPSSLRRIAQAIDPGDATRLLTRWLEIGGPVLAPESRYAERVVRRRQRRTYRKLRQTRRDKGSL